MMLNECLNNLPTTYRGHYDNTNCSYCSYQLWNRTLLDSIYLNYRDIWILHCFN